MIMTLVERSSRTTQGIHYMLVPYLLLLIGCSTITHCYQWSNWSEWSNCSSTCNRGIASKRRECLTGNNCTGHAQEFKTCQSIHCSVKKSSFAFRDKLCSTRDNLYHYPAPPNNTVRPLLWKAHRSSNNMGCTRVQCSSGYYSLTIKEGLDGAECLRADGSTGVCLGKYCAPISCNGILGTEETISNCLHCPPYTTSQPTRNCSKFHITGGSNTGHLMSEIPQGATSVRLEFSSCSIVLQAKPSSPATLSKNTLTLTIGGTTFRRIPNTSTVFKAKGPILVPISVQVENAEGSKSSEQSIEYYKLIEEEKQVTNSNGNETYNWEYGEYGSCSVTCGTGLEVAHVHCRDSEFPDKTLPDFFCSENSLKPFPTVRKCMNSPCPPRWKAHGWGVCTAICGGGVQSRNVECVQSDENDNEKKINDLYCNGMGPRPATRRDCNTHSCGQWSVSEWGTCSRRCGNGGSQTRTIACTNNGGTQIDPINCHHVKPSSVRPCNNGPCDYRWKKEPWGQCNTRCGNGTQTRPVYCSTQHSEKVNETHCQTITKPISQRPCFNTMNCTRLWAQSQWGECQGSCGSSYQTCNVTCQMIINKEKMIVSNSACNESLKPAHTQSCSKPECVQWNETDWGECSVTCGDGVKRRTVQCIDSTTGQAATGCDQSKKPSETATCNRPACCSDNPNVTCNELRKTHSCAPEFMALICCHTCSQS